MRLTLFLGLLLSQNLLGQESINSRGCMLGSTLNSQKLDMMKLYSNTSNDELNWILEKNKEDIESLTGQKPFFRIFRESGSPNAYASNQPYGGYRNSILFGENMLEQSIQDVTVFSQGEWEEGTDYSGVAAILMHEYTHLVEFDQGLHVHNSVKSLELLSDMMAGWMFGNRIETHAENLPELENHILNSAAEKMFALGDYYFNHSDHHGTPAERMNAFWTGYELNKSGYNSYFSAFNRAKTILNILE